MRIIDPLIQEFTHECQLTRKVLERVPRAHYAWRPHEKSMTLGRLAGHIAENPGWGTATLQHDVLVLDGSFAAYTAESPEHMLERFDREVADALAAMQHATDEQMRATWCMKDTEGRIILEMPRAAVFRTFILNHMVHHRGQLTVYLRMLDVPLPAIYGPSADES